MNQIKFLHAILFLLTIISTSVYGQNSADSVIAKDSKFELKNDTLVTDSGLSIFVGQQLIIGNGAGINDTYRSILSKSAAIVPEIWGKNPHYENRIENYVDSKKGKATLKKLIPGGYLTITKIVLLGNKKKSPCYLALLSSDTNEYKCDIALALRLRELLLQ